MPPLRSFTQQQYVAYRADVEALVGSSILPDEVVYPLGPEERGICRVCYESQPPYLTDILLRDRVVVMPKYQVGIVQAFHCDNVDLVEIQPSGCPGEPYLKYLYIKCKRCSGTLGHVFTATADIEEGSLSLDARHYLFHTSQLVLVVGDGEGIMEII